MSEVIEVKAEELSAIMEQSTVRAERILRLEDELAKLREDNLIYSGCNESLRERVAELERLAEAISNDCNTVANERNDLRAALKEQEPVAWVDRDGSGHDVNWYKADIDRLPDGTKLYASPVAQQKVVMPERKELSIYADEEFHRWLEQLPDEAARLNRSKT